MKNLKLGLSALVVAVVTGCTVMPPAEELPDSFYENQSYLWMTTEQKREYDRREVARNQENAREAACVFGTSSIIDRKKLECHNVKGSPEYKEKMKWLSGDVEVATDI